MSVYICMLIISIVFTFLFTKSKKKITKIIFGILAILPFVAVSSVRYNVGTDYFFRYAPNYDIIRNGGIVNSLEPLFVVLVKICVLFSRHYITLFIATSIIINVLILTAIFKYSKNPILSVLIFFVRKFLFSINEFSKTIYSYGYTVDCI